MITKLLHTRYRVHDLEKSIRFYRDVLGSRKPDAAKATVAPSRFLKAPESDEEMSSAV